MTQVIDDGGLELMQVYRNEQIQEKIGGNIYVGFGDELRKRKKFEDRSLLQIIDVYLLQGNQILASLSVISQNLIQYTPSHMHEIY